MIRHLAASVVLLALAGCAYAPPLQESSAEPVLQSVRIDTPGTEGAACALQTPTGSTVVMTPARIRVPRGPGSLTVSCSKGEHFRGAKRVTAQRAIEGGAESYSYPDSVSVPMSLYNPSLKPNYRVQDGPG
jgi:hypothetical protein